MHATKVLNVLVLALSTLGAAQALNVAPDHQAYDGEHAKQVVRRATPTDDADVTGKTGQGTDTSPTQTPPSSSTTTPPTSKTTPPTSSNQTDQTTPTSPSESSDPAETTPPTSSSVSSTPSKTTHESSTSSPPSSTTPSTSSSSTTDKVVYSTSTTVVTTTGANGQSTTYTSERVSTTTPDLARTGSSGNTGMTTQTRNTVIGVVVGVGGAVVLAGIAFLALRLYRRKQPEEGDGLMEYNSGGFVATDKSEVASSNSQSGRSPFQSTLESYHSPTQVNTASNF